MSEIARSGKWNPGGGKWLEVIAASDVASYSRTTPFVTPKSGAAFTRIYCTPGTLSFTENPSRPDNGLLLTVTIKGFSPDDSAQKAAQMVSLLTAEKVLVRFYDNARLVRLAGSLTEPLTFDYQLGTDSDVPGSRGYQITISGTTTFSALYV